MARGAEDLADRTVRIKRELSQRCSRMPNMQSELIGTLHSVVLGLGGWCHVQLSGFDCLVLFPF